MALPFRPPVEPMLAKLAGELPEGEGWLYEPKWDGFRALAFRDGGWAELQSRNLNRFGRYFPELVESILTLREQRLVLDGEIVIAGDAGFDFGALLLRLHPSRSRVQMRGGRRGTFAAAGTRCRCRHPVPATRRRPSLGICLVRR